MSTAQQSLPGFSEASVQKLPKLACIGYVDEIPEGKVSESGNYVVQRYVLRGVGSSRGVSSNFLYRPEWLEPGFDVNSFEEYGEDGSKMEGVYRRHIAVKGGTSTLKGLAGSDEAFGELSAALITATDKSPVGISSVLRDFFGKQNADGPAEIGYILKQKQQKVENPDGTTTYELAQGYEVGEWFFVTPENLKRMKARAKRSLDGSFRVAFDQDDE